MSNPDDRPKKIRKRRTRASVGGTTQSGFANRSMSDLLSQQGGAQSPKKKPAADEQDKPADD